MAQKRMFSKDVTDTEKFYSLPVEAQLLYFHLGIHADVQGFVEPLKIARLAGIKIEAIKPLIDKNFVIPFQSGVVVITDWHINNNVRETYEAPSRYIEEKKSIKLLEQGIYELQENYSSSTVELPHRLGKVRIDKDRIDQDRIGKVRVKKNKLIFNEEQEIFPNTFSSLDLQEQKPSAELSLEKRREYLIEFNGQDLVGILQELSLPIDGVRAKGKQLYDYYSDGKFKSGKPIKNFKQLFTNILRKDAENIKRNYGETLWI